MYAKHYENPTMLSKVTAKNVGDVFLRHTVCGAAATEGVEGIKRWRNPSVRLSALTVCSKPCKVRTARFRRIVTMKHQCPFCKSNPAPVSEALHWKWTKQFDLIKIRPDYFHNENRAVVTIAYNANRKSQAVYHLP